MEIATIAAMLLGKVPEGGEGNMQRESITACKAAVLLLNTAQVAANEWNQATFRSSHPVPLVAKMLDDWADENWDEMATETALDAEEEYLTRKASDNLVPLLQKAGWNEYEHDEANKRLPWPDFQRFLFPKAPSSERLPRFKRWLLDRFRGEQKKADSRFEELCESGITKREFLIYHQHFPEWWDKHKRLGKRETGKLGGLTRANNAAKKKPKKKISA